MWCLLCIISFLWHFVIALKASSETFHTYALTALPINTTTSGVATDTENNVYICGFVERSFDNLSVTLFVAKLSSAADLLWIAEPFNFTSRATALAVYAGRVFVSGSAIFPLDARTDAIVFSVDAATGADAWPQPCRIGLSGDDDARALVVDAGVSPAVVHVAGRVQGRVFSNDPFKTEDTTNHAIPEDLEDAGDAFVASVEILAGAVVAAVQLPLARVNAADALALYGRTLLVAVNTGDDNNTVPVQCRAHPNSRSAIYAFTLPNLSGERLRLRTSTSDDSDGQHARATHISILEPGVLGDAAVYIGLCRLRNGSACAGLQRIDLSSHLISWYVDLGGVPPRQRLSVSVVPTSGAVLVSGHAGAHLAKLGSRATWLLQLPLAAYSPRGLRLAVWVRNVVVPHRVITTTAVTVSADDTLIYTGAWRNNMSIWFPAIGNFCFPNLRRAIAFDDNAPSPVPADFVPASTSMRTSGDSGAPKRPSAAVIAVVCVVISSAAVFVALVCYRATCLPHDTMLLHKNTWYDYEPGVDGMDDIDLYNRTIVNERVSRTLIDEHLVPNEQLKSRLARTDSDPDKIWPAKVQ